MIRIFIVESIFTRFKSDVTQRRGIKIAWLPQKRKASRFQVFVMKMLARVIKDNGIPRARPS